MAVKRRCAKRSIAECHWYFGRGWRIVLPWVIVKEYSWQMTSPKDERHMAPPKCGYCYSIPMVHSLLAPVAWNGDGCGGYPLSTSCFCLRITSPKLGLFTSWWIVILSSGTAESFIGRRIERAVSVCHVSHACHCGLLDIWLTSSVSFDGERVTRSTS